MTLRLNGNLRIENLRGYPEPVVAALRHMLREGATATPDPKRAGFYELTGDGHAFYVHVWKNGSDQPKKLLLLAHWTSPAELASS